VQFSVIRGNLSEIETLARGHGTTYGVDSADRVTPGNLDACCALVRAFARRTGAVVALSGAVDLVSDGERVYCIRNGHPMMGLVTGTGCQLSCLAGAFAAANPDRPLEAAAAAVCAMGLCGEIAHDRLGPLDGSGSYRTYLMDAVCRLTPEQLEKGARYELR
ncbi:MAG: hydroxyethylthiazole kinase, partial [Eubacteriales bacterium]|nr:hydroxyethylthiazole kinase [Eubacteriales bacterium]